MWMHRTERGGWSACVMLGRSRHERMMEARGGKGGRETRKVDIEEGGSEGRDQGMKSSIFTGQGRAGGYLLRKEKREYRKQQKAEM